MKLLLHLEFFLSRWLGLLLLVHKQLLQIRLQPPHMPSDLTYCFPRNVVPTSPSLDLTGKQTHCLTTTWLSALCLARI